MDICPHSPRRLESHVPRLAWYSDLFFAPAIIPTHSNGLSVPEFMDRRCYLNLQGGRAVSGVLRGFDMFLNLVVDQAYEELGGGQRTPAGLVVSLPF
jgi:hypothetical protein